MRIDALIIAGALTAIACDGATPVAVDNDSVFALASSSHPPCTIAVAEATGDPATDVASIRTAVTLATAGCVVQFAAGTYALGLNHSHIVVSAPGVSLVGHTEGTTLEGSDVLDWEVPVVFHLTGGRQAVRRITFQRIGEAIRVGFDNPERGGYVIEDCTFRISVNPVWVGLQSQDVTRIAHNLFVNTVIPSWTDGMTIHFVGNTMLASEPDAIPLFGQPLFTDIIESRSAEGFPLATNNVVADNRAVGFPDGTHIASHGNGVTRSNIVRNNVYEAQRAYSPGDFGTMVVLQGWDEESITDRNVIEGNSLLGSEGIGLWIWGATRTRVLHNTIHDVADNPTTGIRGRGIVVEESAPGQQIVENSFAGNAFYDVVLRSDDNLVVLEEPDDRVRDLGQDNRIVGGGDARAATMGLPETPDPAAARKAEILSRWRGRAPR